jgi:hypothetical protein
MGRGDRRVKARGLVTRKESSASARKSGHARWSATARQPLPHPAGDRVRNGRSATAAKQQARRCSTETDRYKRQVEAIVAQALEEWQAGNRIRPRVTGILPFFEFMAEWIKFTHIQSS